MNWFIKAEVISMTGGNVGSICNQHVHQLIRRIMTRNNAPKDIACVLGIVI